jgi:hypothetical protein
MSSIAAIITALALMTIKAANARFTRSPNDECVTTNRAPDYREAFRSVIAWLGSAVST